MEVRLLLVALGLAYDIAYFRTGMFQPYRAPGLYEVTAGLETEDRRLAAFGYIDGDK